MPVTISNRPDSIAGYDIVVSISEETVNAQLLKLYQTPISPERLPPPSKIKNFKPMPPTAYFINHNFSMHMLNQKKSTADKQVFRQDGIDGFILCPKIRFRPITNCSGTDLNALYKKANIEMTFQKDPVTGKDSILSYYGDAEDSPELTPKIINGYTLTWAVDIGRQDVGDVMNDIINAAKDSNDPVLATDKVTSQLNNYVDSRSFTVSSIFCLFEEQTMASNFKLLDKNRQPDTSPTIIGVMESLTMYFTNIRRETKANGAPTLENPFVLGYFISQKIHPTAEIDPTLSTARTPEYFKPKQFGLSVSPGESLDQAIITTSGTLNFCMLTHRDGPEGHKKVEVDEKDMDAGVLHKNFFDITKTLGRTQDVRGNVQGHDGIMAFSKVIFSGLWMKSVASDILMNTVSAYPPMFAKGLKEPDSEVQISMGGSQRDAIYLNGWDIYRAWKTRERYQMPTSNDRYLRRSYIVGDSCVKMSFTSDTNSITSVEDGLTHKRRIYFDIDIRNTFDYVYQFRSEDFFLFPVNRNPQETNSWFDEKRLRGFDKDELLPPGRGESCWHNGLVIEYNIHSLVRVVLTPGAVGKWEVDIDETNSKNLFKEGQELEYNLISPSEAYGNFTGSYSYGDTSSWQSKRVAAFRDAVKAWDTSTKNIFIEKLQNSFNNLGSTIIMPAGDVFTFAGLDSDDAGNIYAQINYATQGGVSVGKVNKAHN